MTSEEFVIVITNDLWQNSSQFTLNILAALLACVGATDCIKLLVEFLYRWLLVVRLVYYFGPVKYTDLFRQHEISVYRLTLLAVSIYLCACVNSFLYYMTLSSHLSQEWTNLLLRNGFSSDERFVVANTHSGFALLVSLVGFSTALFTYTIIIICSRQILTVLLEQRGVMSIRTVKMHRGLNQMMFTQVTNFLY